jgi:hypothetical protein
VLSQLSVISSGNHVNHLFGSSRLIDDVLLLNFRLLQADCYKQTATEPPVWSSGFKYLNHLLNHLSSSVNFLSYI